MIEKLIFKFLDKKDLYIDDRGKIVFFKNNEKDSQYNFVYVTEPETLYISKRFLDGMELFFPVDREPLKEIIIKYVSDKLNCKISKVNIT